MKSVADRWPLTLAALLTVLIVACGSAAQPADQESPPPVREVAQSTPIPQPEATTLPDQVESAQDSITIVMSAQPGSVDPWDPNCNATLDTAVCNEIVNEPLTWITSDTFELVTLSTVEEWEQLEVDQWRFTLRQGVKFHNGEPWNAEAAKAAIDQNGDVNNSSQSYSYHGPISAEVVDEFTVDVSCEVECPILPRSMIFSRIQEPKWYASATPEERGRNVISIGPYRMIEWRPGIDIQMEAYEDYVPNPNTSIVDGQPPNIKNLVNVWRPEQLVRASMVQTGEAEWAADIGFENKPNVPKWKQSTTSEVYALILDNMWHPELKKKQVREALNLAIDCQAITNALLDGIPCWGNISPSGSVGLTPRNSDPYPYDPERAKALLEEAGYDPVNKITIYTRSGYCCRDLEFQEAVVNYWKEVGVNAELQVVERTRHKEITSSGCGRFDGEAGYEGVWDCAQREPPAPNFNSSNATITATSNEMLDTQVQAMRRVGCLHTSSMACYPDIWEKILVANATPPGDLRQERMEEIADFIHDEYIFVPLVQVQLAYGLAENLEWEPLYAPRLRVNTMRFTQ
jgi:peptide/nickel transport system substrate-binding protein